MPPGRRSIPGRLVIMTILSGARLISGVERSEVKGKSIERVRLSNGAEEAEKAAADLVDDEGGWEPSTASGADYPI